MKTLQFMRYIIGFTLLFSSLYGENDRQTVTKELLSKTLSGGITTLDWVVRYEANSTTPLEDVVITDDFSSAQTYVPSTEAHPNGWSVVQSPNRFVWEIGDGAETGYSQDFPEPEGALVVNGDGDGWAPIPYTTSSGQKKIYFINHGQLSNKTSFGCTGACVGTWPKRLPVGDSSGLSSATSEATETVIMGTKLYYPVSRSADSGIACYDMETDTECGYLSLSSLSGLSGSRIAIDGMQKIGSSVYVMDGNAIVYKVNIAASGSMSSAGSFDMSTLNMPTNSFRWSGPDMYGIGSKTNGTKIYFFNGDSSGTGVVGCFDSVGMSGCTGWGNVKNVPNLTAFAVNTFFYYDTAMTKTAICVSDASSLQCLDLLTGSNVSKVDILSAYPLNTQWATAKELTIGTKTYFPSMGEDFVYCHDWRTASACPTSTLSDNVTGNANNYAVSLDSDGCAWVYGHTNIMWSFNPETNTVPCQGQKFEIEDTYDASKNWCASENVEWKYTQLQINGLSSNMFSDINITFYDANGNVILTDDITNASSYSRGLYTAPFVSGQPIHYKITGTRNPNANPNTPPPVITIGVEGPPREFCFKTTVPCPVTGDIRNKVEVKLKGESSIDSSAEVVEDAQGLCAEVLPEPKQCLDAEPELKCSKTGFTLDFSSFSPSPYTAANTQMTVLSPMGATLTKWGSTWHLNGAVPGDTVKISMQGVNKGAGAGEGNDLCCDGELNVTIPEDEVCEVEEPHIYIRKMYDEVTGVFDLNVRIMSTIYAPQVLTVTDTLPAGITITGIDPRSTSEWMCSNTFPVVGPASINCAYIGTMPATGVKDLYLTSTIDNSQMPVENCAYSGVVGTDGMSVWTSPMANHCITIGNDDNESNTTCGDNEILIDGVCEESSDSTDDNETNITCADNEIFIDGACTQLPDTPDGQPCDDGNTSTVSDLIINGECIGTPRSECQTDGDCAVHERCELDIDGIGTCLMIVPSRQAQTKPMITLGKTAPKECKAGGKCTFTFVLKNKGTNTFSGPLAINDIPKEFRGKLVSVSPKGWKAKRTSKRYVCTNPKVTLKAGESQKVKLTIRIPQRASGYLNNCAKLDDSSGKLKVMALQTMLQREGFDPNGIDGGMGKGTKKALSAYMKTKGIKSQKEAIEELTKDYPYAISKKSCVKVKIRKTCQKDEKLVGDRCKSRCKKWQNWNGKTCVSCPKGTKWDKRKKVCRKKVDVNVKPRKDTCKKGYIYKKGYCIKPKKEEKPKCIPFITHYSTLLGICVPNISIGIGGGGSSPTGHGGGDKGPAGY